MTFSKPMPPIRARFFFSFGFEKAARAREFFLVRN
jgi:hypothetical protein